MTNTGHYQWAVLLTIHINRRILCYRKGNEPYCNHSHTIKISKRKKTIFWIHHEHWIYSSTLHKPQIHSATLIFWSLLTRLLLYRSHIEQGSIPLLLPSTKLQSKGLTLPCLHSTALQGNYPWLIPLHT